MLIHLFIYTVERGKLTPKDVVLTESSVSKPEEKRAITVSLPSPVSLYFYLLAYIVTLES